MKKIKKGYRKSLRKISNEEKEKKRQYGCERYKNFSENKKEKFVEYREQYHRVRKKCYIIITSKYFNLEEFASL